jgi:hypothetical protein
MKREEADPGTWSRRDVFRVGTMATAAGVMAAGRLLAVDDRYGRVRELPAPMA